VGQDTSLERLNGRVYTPPSVAERMVGLLRWPLPERSGRLLDPACGEGVFLEAVMRRLVELHGATPRTARRVSEDLVGWDIDAEALTGAAERLDALSRSLGLGGARPRLEHRDALLDDDEPFSCVVGNPPYLEAKRMPESLKALVRARCPLAARGAFDLYAAFLERALQLGDLWSELCFIVPNRVLVLASTDALRREILRLGALRVLDLSRERVFQGAAVYPVILHLDRSRASETLSGGSALGEGLAGPLGSIVPVPPEDPRGRGLLADLLTREGSVPLGDLAECRWCVSFHKAGLRERFTFPQAPPSPEAPWRRFLGGGRFSGNREVLPYRVDWQGGWILYDREALSALGNPLPDPELFSEPKVALCQNARRARAALDREGFVLKDTFILLRPRDRIGGVSTGLLEWLVLLFNSEVFHFLYEHVYAGTRKAGGFLHFLPGHLERLPIPPPPDAEGARALHAARVEGRAGPEEVEAWVRRAWGLSPEDDAYLRTLVFPEP
jgi:hypothetical protein